MAGSDSSSSVVIVALPESEDEVWKISSEPEPHLTLLYLGDAKFDDNQFALLSGYVKYAASFLHQFSMEVIDRGELGDAKADVLFFHKAWSKEITRFREQLLQEPNVNAAYNSSEQFEGWTPHLTLGYPETPAKKQEPDRSIYSVRFDRIAVWNGDYSGPTYDLKPFEYDDLDISMSQITTPHSAEVEKFLSHYGVRGMKWGIRKSSDGGGLKARTESLPDIKTKSGEKLTISGDKTPALAKLIAKMSPAFRKKVENSYNFTLKNSKGENIGEMSLKKESDTSLNVVWVGVNDKDRGKGYASAAMKAAVDHAKNLNLKTVTLEVPGNSPDARHIYEKMGFKEDPSKSEPWDPVWGGLTAMELTLPSKGGKASHSQEETNAFLAHYGIKGMKWGVRRADSSSGGTSKPEASSDSKMASAAQSKINQGGVRSVSNHELQLLVNRMNLERQYSQLQTQNKSELDRGLQVTQKILKTGKTVEDVRRFLETPTGKAVKQTLKGAFAAGKVAAAAYTGGASSAATVGAGLAVRRAANHYTNVGR